VGFWFGSSAAVYSLRLNCTLSACVLLVSRGSRWSHFAITGTELASLKEEEGGGGWGVADADAEDEEEEGDDAVWGMGTGLLGPARKFQPGGWVGLLGVAGRGSVRHSSEPSC
jgi:hypothetical protein